MDDDSVFTKRFKDCVRKPHAERTEQDIDFICHTLRRLSEFQGCDTAYLRDLPPRMVYEHVEKDYILYSTGEKALCWYYVLSGSVLLSMNYFFSTGSSFGRCINSDVRSDQCHVLEPSQLLRITYTPEEVRHFEERAAKIASRSQLTASLEQLANGSSHISAKKIRRRGGQLEEVQITTHNGIVGGGGGGGISTSAASTKAEPTTVPPSQNSSRNERPSLACMEGVTIRQKVPLRSKWSLMSLERPESRDLDALDPVGAAEEEETPARHFHSHSADLLERDRRSRSEERPYFTFDPAQIKASLSNDSLNKAMEEPIMQEPLAPPPSSSADRTEQLHPSTTEVTVRRRRSDRERRFSAPPSDKKIRDSVGSLDYLSESQVDSDDEESVQSETSSATSMDAVLEVFSKPPPDRNDEDIERVMDVLQYMPVFANLTSNIRRALFHELMLYPIEQENTVVLDNGMEIDKWYVVLNGQLKLLREAEHDKIYHVGDWFGVSRSLKLLPHRGRLVTAERSCTLCYVSASTYSAVMTQGEENLLKVEREGRIVSVLERRAVDRREGYFVVQATPQTLLDQLVEESVDDSFHRDFLLTYRTFLDSAEPITAKLRETWQTGLPEQRDRITMVVLNWVTEHFIDFEGHEEMTSFLDWFEERLLEDGKVGEKRALDKARSLYARLRIIEMDRAGTNSPLHFDVVGGWEVGYPIFVSAVEPDSIPEGAGLRVGDQILEINDVKAEKKEQREVLSILRKNFKLTLRVRCNLPEFKQFITDPPKPPPSYVPQKARNPGPLPLVPRVPISRCNSSEGGPASADDTGRRGRSFSNMGRISTRTPSKGSTSPQTKKKKGPKIIRPLSALGKIPQFDKLRRMRFRFSGSSSSSSSIDPEGSGPVKAKGRFAARKTSTDNLLNGDKPSPPVRASSMEDIHSIGKNSSSSVGTAAKIVDGVVKLYQPDHSHKYIDISPATTIADLIHKGVKEFYPDKFVVTPADEYCICMVTVQSRNGPIRNSVLPNHMTDLANYIGLECRYYLKERAFHGTLVQDDEADHIFKESRQWEIILNLTPKQVAEELTRQGSELFCSIDSSEYIADLWRNPNQLTKENLAKFESIPNEEMYWVVTTVVSETRVDIRAKLIKHFIKTAKWCKELKNYNTMCQILSGLSHGLVQRQRAIWEKVPTKYRRSMDELLSYMNPFHNMAKYRELQRNTPPPLIPFFPIIKKDLTFLYDGNETQVDGLVNFEKLRMLSQQIRVIRTYCTQPIMPEPPQVDLGRYGNVLKTLHHSIRLRNRSPVTFATITDNALKEVYYHHRMTKMARKHLARKYVVQEEDLLERIADSSERVVQLRKNPPSPLNKGKRSSLGNPLKEKHKSTNFSISPSSTTASFGSDSAAAECRSVSTPPSPRKLSAPVLSVGRTEPASSATPPPSPTFPLESVNGGVKQVLC